MKDTQIEYNQRQESAVGFIFSEFFENIQRLLVLKVWQFSPLNREITDMCHPSTRALPRHAM